MICRRFICGIRPMCLPRARESAIFKSSPRARDFIPKLTLDQK